MSIKKADYAIPFNGDLHLVETALKTGFVSEVYFAAGRKDDLINNHYGGKEGGALPSAKIRKLMALCRKYGAKTNLLCNAPSLVFADGKKLFKYIHALRNLDAITISDPITIKTFKKEFPSKDIQASLIMNLDSYVKVKQALRLGVGTITLPGRFTRDIKALKEINRLKREFPYFRVKLIANISCFLDCLFLPEHYMFGLFSSLIKRNGNLEPKNTLYPKTICHSRKPAEFIAAPFIRPEDVNYYRKKNIVDTFKLVYRNQASSNLRVIYEAYFNGRFKGNLFKLMQIRTKPDDGRHKKKDSGIFSCDNGRFPKDFVKVVTSCDKKCEKCDYCDEIAEITGIK